MPCRLPGRPGATRYRHAPRAALLVGAAVLLAPWSGPGVPLAHADFELGGHGGARLFAADGQLGRAESGVDGVAPQHMATLGVRLAWVPVARAAVEAELSLVPTWSRAPSGPSATVLGYRAALRINLLTGRVRPFLLAGFGAQTLLVGASPGPDLGVAVGLRNDSNAYVVAGAGAELDLGDRIGLRLDARTLLGPAVHDAPVAADLEVLLGVYARFDRSTPRALSRARPDCPEPDGSRANNGDRPVARRASRSASEPASADVGSGSSSGDEDDLPLRASDSRLPLEPPALDPDGDGDLDLTLNRDDRCPDRAGPPEGHGCPDLDSDGDGVVDRLDRCVERPESDNGWQDEDGCPDEVPEDLRPFVGVIEGLKFRPSSSELSRDSEPLLDDLARSLHDHPEVRLEIAAHTDTSGNPERNTRLSQERAEQVQAGLVLRGIGAARLRAVGYGPSRPLQDNATQAGRNANRRTELRLVR